jgi:hypothetical protein
MSGTSNFGKTAIDQFPDATAKDDRHLPHPHRIRWVPTGASFLVNANDELVEDSSALAEDSAEGDATAPAASESEGAHGFAIFDEGGAADAADAPEGPYEKEGYGFVIVGSVGPEGDVSHEELSSRSDVLKPAPGGNRFGSASAVLKVSRNQGGHGFAVLKKSGVAEDLEQASDEADGHGFVITDQS